MLSIYKDFSGQTVVNITDCETIREVKVVCMKNLGLTDFDQQMFSQMLNVEEMDISGNLLETIPNYINLPNLKRLNCSRNKFSDLMFVRHFPNLEELDMTGNAVAFSDFCIASLLCPTLKRISNQEINIKKLNQKMEDQLKPVISKIWTDHFHATYRKSMTDSEFEALGEKFRTMLKHASIPGTKLLKKFKDFKLSCLIEQFLNMVRNSPIADDLPSTMGGKAKKNYTWKKSSDESRVSQSVKTADPSASNTELGNFTLLCSAESDSYKKMQNNVIIETESTSQVDSPSVIVVPDDQNALEVGSDTIIVFTEEVANECNSPNVIYVTKEAITSADGAVYQEVYVDNCNQLTVESNSESISQSEAVEQIPEKIPDVQHGTDFSKQPISKPLEKTELECTQNEVVELQTLPCNTKSVTTELVSAQDKVEHTATKVNTENEEKHESVGNDKSNLCAPQASNDGERKLVKFWLYDKEIKPLRRKTPKPPSTRGRRRGSLTKYIVGPASEYSLANKRTTNSGDQTQSLELPTPASIARSLYKSTPDAFTSASQSHSIVTSPTKVYSSVSRDDTTNSDTTTLATLMTAEPTNGCVQVRHEEINMGSETGKVTILNLDSYSEQNLSPVSEITQFDACNDGSQAVVIEVSTETGEKEVIQKMIIVPEHDNKKIGPPKKRVRFLDEVEQELKSNDDSTSNDCARQSSLPKERLDAEECVEDQQHSECQT